MRAFDFTYDSYRCLLETVSTRFKVVTAEDILDGVSGRWCFLRHDVDNGLELALNMARIEKSFGITTTYYLMTSSSVYNCFSPEGREMMRELLGMGHCLGLHFCLKSHGQYDRDSIIEGVFLEKAFLEKIFRVPISTVSFHQPVQALANPEKDLKSLDFSLKKYGLLNTYSTEDTAGAFYLSDSLMSFEGMDPLMFLSNTNAEKIQLVIHPVWYDEEIADTEARWDRAMLVRFRRMLREKLENERSMNRPREVRLQ